MLCRPDWLKEKRMKPFWKSMTLQGLVAMVAVSAPGLADPIWRELAAAGLADEWVSRIKVGVYLAGALAVAYGRVRASQPLGK